MRKGVASASPKYNYPDDGQQLPNSVDAVRALGCPTFKGYLTPAFATDYPKQTSLGATPTSLKTLAQTPVWAAQFAKPFQCFSMTCFTFANGVTNWCRVEPTAAKLQAEEDEIYELGCHWLSTYNGRGLRFVIQTWENDWALMDVAGVPDTYVPEVMVPRFVAFFAARKRGIMRARRDTPSDCQLLMAYEANRVLESRLYPHRRRMARDIAPRIQPDVISLSCYEWTIDTALGFGADLAAWTAYTVPLMRKAFRIIDLCWPGVPKQVGEFGYPEVQAAGLGRDITPMINTFYAEALAAGCTDFIYWAAFDNEESAPGVPLGYYIVKPDGSQSVAGAALAALP